MSAQQQIEREVQALLAAAREEAEAAKQATRAAALNAAAVTITGSQYGHIGDEESHVRQVLDLAERYAAWIRTGEDPERTPQLPPVDF